MRNIRFNNLSDGNAIAQAAGTGFNPLVDVCIARFNKKGLMGGVVFSNYTGHGGSVGMHVASFQPRWISPDLLKICFDYPFNQMGVKKIFGQVPETNRHALEFDLKLGFQPEAVLEDVYPNGHCILLAMKREECRFLVRDDEDGR